MTGDADADLARGISTLLRRPLLLARSDPDEFIHVKRNADKLQRWFSRNAGYGLRVDSDIIRLFKAPSPDADRTHPAHTRQGVPFTAHRYALMCLALACLEREDGQIDLAGLAEQMKLTAGAGEGFKRLDLADRAERRAIVDVVRMLTDWGVLRLRDGDESGLGWKPQ